MHVNFRGQKCDQERSRGDPKIQRHYSSNTAQVECKNRSDTINIRGHWNHLTSTQTIPEQRTGKARNQETARQ